MGNWDQAVGNVWVSARHPRSEGQLHFCVRPVDAWERLDALLATIPHPWEREGWTIAMDDLMCPKCGCANIPNAKPMLELQRDAKGIVLVCSQCGHAEPQP